MHFRHFHVGVVSLPSGRCGCVGRTPRGVYFGRKTVFLEWVLCADGHAVPSCTQCFFGASMWGWYHYSRRALHAVETLDAQELRRRIRRFYAAPVLALCGLNLPSSGTHATPTPNRAHSGSHAETGVFPSAITVRLCAASEIPFIPPCFYIHTFPGSLWPPLSATALPQTIFHRVFQLLPQTPHVCFHVRKRVHTRLSKKNRTQGHTRRNRWCFGWGWDHYPRSVPHVSETLRGQGVERQTLPL